MPCTVTRWLVGNGVALPLPCTLEILVKPVLVSSLRMMPLAVAVPSVPGVGLLSVTVKPSSGSAVVSPATAMVSVLLVSPAAKLSVPLGRVPPSKSAPLAATVPLPVTA